MIPILGELEETAVTPDGAALHLWNTDSPAEEHWRLRVAPPGEVVPPGEDVSASAPARRARPEPARENAAGETGDVLLETEDALLEAEPDPEGDELRNRIEELLEEQVELMEAVARESRERRGAGREGPPR